MEWLWKFGMMLIWFAVRESSRAFVLFIVDRRAISGSDVLQLITNIARASRRTVTDNYGLFG